MPLSQARKSEPELKLGQGNNHKLRQELRIIKFSNMEKLKKTLIKEGMIIRKYIFLYFNQLKCFILTKIKIGFRIYEHKSPKKIRKLFKSKTLCKNWFKIFLIFL